MILTRILAYLSAAGVSIGVWQGGRLRHVRRLTPDEEGLRQFEALLAQRPRTPVSLVVDTVEEQFRHEILPRAHGRDRREMTQRRLRQLLGQSPYRAVMWQGPAEEAPRADHYLFMGLTGQELLRPWLACLSRLQSPLAGIWLAPVLSERLLPRLAPGVGRLLLVSEQTGGLRLSYFEGGALRFSRLAPVDNALFDDPLEGYGDEIERTRQYLLSQRLLDREDRLRVYLIDPLGSLGQLHSLLPESAGFHCETVSRHRLVTELGLPPQLLAESTDALYLSLLTRAPDQANLQPADLRRSYLAHLAQRWLYTAGLAWLGLSLLLGAGLTWNTWRHDEAASEYAHQAEAARQQEWRRVGSEKEARALRLRLQQLAAWRHVLAHRRDPASEIQRLLDSAPATTLRFRQVRWESGGASGSMEARLSGEVMAFDGDYQAAHVRVDELAARLAEEGWRVRVERYPLDPAPDRTLAGDFGRGTGRVPAEFHLILSRGGPS